MIVIGDVHGEYDLLMKLFDKLPHEDVCFVGDLIDRGHDSRKVVDFVRENSFPCIVGNHEEFLIKSYDDEGYIERRTHDLWDFNGGLLTRGSYGGDFDLMMEHREWMKTLPLKIWINDLTVVSHSCYLPYMNQNDKDCRDEVLWDREFKVVRTPIRNIIGHTIVRDVTENYNYLMIDTGAHHYGCLSAYDTKTGIIYQAKKEKL